MMAKSMLEGNMTFSIMTFSIMTFSIMTFSITIRKFDTQHNYTLFLCRVAKILAKCYM